MSVLRDPYQPPRLATGDDASRHEAVGEPPSWSSPFAGADAEVVATATAAVDEASGDLFTLSSALYADPELGFEEHRSAARVADLLRARGFTPEVGVYGLDTALKCSVSNGSGPTIAVISEYDALPGIGHGCGHNVICAAGVGAFLGAAAVVERLGGTVVLLGTPAEENGSGKEIMARNGAFEGVDAAMMVHPLPGPSALTFNYLGLREVHVVYTGLTAHASATPQLGINALDAAVLAYTGISAMRQQLPDADRVHGIITDGGKRPNVIPERAELHYYLRSPSTASLIALSNKVQAIFEGAALATGAQLELFWDDCPPCLPLRSNSVLETQFAARFNETGEQIFHEVDTGQGLSGSTDMGNVSERLPSIHPMLGIAPAGLAPHTREFADYSDTDRSREVIRNGAVAMAATVADLLADPAVLAAAQASFEETGGAADLTELMP